MKYLSNYMEEKQTAAFNDAGAFFAFSTKQFEESKKEGINYMNVGSGLICPEDKARELIARLELIHKEAIKQDIEENGIENIIERELHNHEAGYTMEIDDTFEALRAYGITKAEVIKKFNSIDWSKY